MVAQQNGMCVAQLKLTQEHATDRLIQTRASECTGTFSKKTEKQKAEPFAIAGGFSEEGVAAIFRVILK
jgi:hypothetical protein